MVLVIPAEMGMTDATFGVHGLAGTSGAFMNVVTETSALANLKLDNVVVNSALFTPIGGTSIYSVGTIPVAPGAHSLLGSVPYSGLVYDYGISWNTVSYAYPVASKLSWSTAVSTGCIDEESYDEDKDNHLLNTLDHSGKNKHATRHSHGAENDDGQECHD